MANLVQALRSPELAWTYLKALEYLTALSMELSMLPGSPGPQEAEGP